MRFSLARESWFLVACIGAIVNLNAAAASVLEVDLVFPRNETYAPTTWFPVVFAFQNAERARLLNPHISYTIRNWDDMLGNDGASFSHDLRLANWSSHDPYFVYNYFHDVFAKEGSWWLTWHVTWESCNEVPFSAGLSRDMIRNSSSWSVLFTTKNSAQEIDLVAVTNNKTCPAELGVVINVTDTTMTVPFGVDWSGGDTCAVVASSTPTPTANPCQVKIDSVVVASMSASLAATLCRGIDPPANCTNDDESVAQQLVAPGVSGVGISCVLAAFGAFSFF
ncbi:hypothetical protein V501_07602 [Pseudogymnoascus sp. VKM F-4519 (FW-2642)]|nr:hypothetical protein V501_07602 [Pseudogymnoascus sp. VKM F-4519 (FW-2642)]